MEGAGLVNGSSNSDPKPEQIPEGTKPEEEHTKVVVSHMTLNTHLHIYTLHEEDDWPMLRIS